VQVDNLKKICGSSTPMQDECPGIVDTLRTKPGQSDILLFRKGKKRPTGFIFIKTQPSVDKVKFGQIKGNVISISAICSSEGGVGKFLMGFAIFSAVQGDYRLILDVKGGFNNPKAFCLYYKLGFRVVLNKAVDHMTGVSMILSPDVTVSNLFDILDDSDIDKDFTSDFCSGVSIQDYGAKTLLSDLQKIKFVLSQSEYSKSVGNSLLSITTIDIDNYDREQKLDASIEEDPARQYLESLSIILAGLDPKDKQKLTNFINEMKVNKRAAEVRYGRNPDSPDSPFLRHKRKGDRLLALIESA